MTKTIVLDRRTNENPSLDYGDFVTCCNCGKTMLADIGIDKCPECNEETLAWANERIKKYQMISSIITKSIC